jgi:protein TonB
VRPGARSADDAPLPVERPHASADDNRLPLPTPVARAANSAEVDAAVAKYARAQTASSGVFVPPKVTHHWRPPYPQDAYEANAEGEAEVLVTISADGSLKDAHINRSSGSESLDQASLDAVKRYTFRAAQKGGNAIEAQANVVLEWTISPPLEFTVVSGMTASRGSHAKLSASN